MPTAPTSQNVGVAGEALHDPTLLQEVYPTLEKTWTMESWSIQACLDGQGLF